MKIIQLTRGLVAKISDRDYKLVSQYKWRAIRVFGSGRGGKIYRYGFKAGHRKNNKVIWMHNFICRPPEGSEVDHRDGDRLNNMRSNMRAIPHWANCLNRGKRSNGKTSKYLGVCKLSEKTRFSAYIYVRKLRKHIHLGYYDDDAEAARAYDKAARKFHGKYARLNFRRK